MPNLPHPLPPPPMFCPNSMAAAAAAMFWLQQQLTAPAVPRLRPPGLLPPPQFIGHPPFVQMPPLHVPGRPAQNEGASGTTSSCSSSATALVEKSPEVTTMGSARKGSGGGSAHSARERLFGRLFRHFKRQSINTFTLSWDGNSTEK